jgi:hypothetical protein
MEIINFSCQFLENTWRNVFIKALSFASFTIFQDSNFHHLIMLSGCVEYNIKYYSYIFQDCLAIINRYCKIDVRKTDRWGRTLTDVATPICNQFLAQLGLCYKKFMVLSLHCKTRYEIIILFQIYKRETFLILYILGSSCIQVPVVVELSYARLTGADNPSNTPSQSFMVGSVQLTSKTGWMELEGVLQSVLVNFFNLLDTGLKTKKTSRLDPEITSDTAQYSLGLGLKAIQHYSIGIASAFLLEVLLFFGILELVKTILFYI